MSRQKKTPIQPLDMLERLANIASDNHSLDQEILTLRKIFDAVKGKLAEPSIQIAHEVYGDPILTKAAALQDQTNTLKRKNLEAKRDASLTLFREDFDSKQVRETYLALRGKREAGRQITYLGMAIDPLSDSEHEQLTLSLENVADDLTQLPHAGDPHSFIRHMKIDAAHKRNDKLQPTTTAAPLRKELQTHEARIAEAYNKLARAELNAARINIAQMAIQHAVLTKPTLSADDLAKMEKDIEKSLRAASRAQNKVHNHLSAAHRLA